MNCGMPYDTKEEVLNFFIQGKEQVPLIETSKVLVEADIEDWEVLKLDCTSDLLVREQLMRKYGLV